MSYKPDTPVVDESQGVMIANLLNGMGISITVNDPLALDNARKILHNSINIEPDIEKTLLESEVLIIATPWPQYKNINPKLIQQKTIIDYWRILNQKDFPDCRIIYPGRSSLIGVSSTL